MDLSIRKITNIFANPELYSIRIGDECIPLHGDGVKVRRSNKYIEIINSRYIITIAMTVSYLKHCKALERELSRLSTSPFTPYYHKWRRILATSHDDIFADVIIQEFPEGELLTKFLVSADKEELQMVLGAIQHLEEMVDSLNGSFETLSPNDIIIGEDGLLYPFRYDKLHFRRSPGEVSGCDALRKYISKEITDFIMPTATYPRRERYSGHLATDTLHEDRIVVEDPTGAGYIDSSNVSVIPSIFISADRFAEGRAMVESKDGFGLINTDGEYLLPTIYESLGYNPDTGITSAKKGGQWAYFSYCGEQLTEFTDEYPNEDITLEQILRLKQNLL